MQNITIFHDVRFTFNAHLSGFLGFLFSLKGNIILIGNGLGPDKTALKITMDHPGGLGGVGAALYRPGSRLLRANGEIGFQFQELVAGADQTIQSGLFQAHLIQKHRRFLWF